MDNSENPFMEDYTTEYEIPPFDQIKYEHYIPAIKAGIEERNQEIAAITNNRAMPDFDNTILALDNSGKLLTKVSYVFYALSESDNTPEMEKISEGAGPGVAAGGGAGGRAEGRVGGRWLGGGRVRGFLVGV